MRLLPLLLTVFIDSLGFGLIMPLLSPLIMDGGIGFLSESTSIPMRGWLYGLLAASFCLGQFFGSPILGAISDRKGRKKILLATLWLGAFGYMLGAFSIYFHSVAGLFLSRILAGVAAGNFSIAQSCIADITPDDQKAKNFGLLGMAWGVGFILGPFLGGKFSDPSICSLFSWSTPFWIACLICLTNIGLVAARLPETLSVRSTNRKISILAGLFDIKKAFTIPKLRGIFLVMFIFCFGWGFFTEFVPLFLIRHLEFGVGRISDFYAYVGLLVAVCQGILIRPFVKRFSPQVLLTCALFALGCGLIFTSTAQSYAQLFLFLPIIAFPESLIFPSAAAMISNLSPKDSQGEVLGLYNSLQWAAIGFSPLFSGSFVAAHPHLPLTGASFCMFLGFSVLCLISYRNKRKMILNSDRSL